MYLYSQCIYKCDTHIKAWCISDVSILSWHVHISNGIPTPQIQQDSNQCYHTVFDEIIKATLSHICWPTSVNPHLLTHIWQHEFIHWSIFILTISNEPLRHDQAEGEYQISREIGGASERERERERKREREKERLDTSTRERERERENERERERTREKMRRSDRKKDRQRVCVRARENTRGRARERERERERPDSNHTRQHL